MFYYYGYNTLPMPCGFMPAPFPSSPLPLYDSWSFPFSHPNYVSPIPSALPKQSLPASSRVTNTTQASLLQGEQEQQAASSKEDGSDAFTEKRNIIPNNINHILAYVQRRSKSEPIIIRAIALMQKTSPYSSSFPFTARRFYAYQTYLKGKIDIHVSKKTLGLVASNLDLHSDIFSLQEQLFYNRVCRAAISHYLRNVAALTTLNSRRLRETSKKDHLRAQRHLLQFMKTLDDWQNESHE